MHKFVLCKVRDMKAQLRQMMGEPAQVYVLDYGTYENIPGYWAEVRNGDDGSVLGGGHFATAESLESYGKTVERTYGRLGKLIDAQKIRGVSE